MTFSCTAFIALYYFVDEIRILIWCGARQRRKSRCHHSHRTCRNQSRRRRFGRKDGSVGGGLTCDIWVSKYDYVGGKHESRSLITVKGPVLINFGGKIGVRRDGGVGGGGDWVYYCVCARGQVVVPARGCKPGGVKLNSNGQSM